MVNKKTVILFIIILTLISLSAYAYKRTWYLDSVISKIDFNRVYAVDDKGVQMAIGSGFIQDVKKSQEQDGLEFTVDNIIVDKKRIVVFYTIKNKLDHRYIKRIYYSLYDENKEPIEGSTSPNISYEDTDLNKVKRVHDSFEIILSEEIKTPSKIKMDITLNESKYTSQEYDEIMNSNKMNDSDNSSYMYTLYIPIDKKIFEAKEKIYNINETIDIQNQNIFIDNIVVYPTVATLDIRYDEDNTMEVFEIKDLKLSTLDKEYNLGINSIISSNKDEFTRSLYFESPYFEDREELYINGSGIKALEKDKLEVVVDIENKKLIKLLVSNLKLKKVSDEKDSFLENKNHYELKFECDRDISFSFEFKDKDNASFRAYSVGYSEEDDYKEIYYVIDKDVKYKNPITLTISDYDNLINKPFKIEVK
ncbi:DUF4179 domain-containing protein [Tepidibacter aestuarii]|uniref:DUF4179 domain-containing protein n=1 Tax=Tepidibacter aestuarii TaxID=2925782 RepID=UPI0020C0DF4D|nr:DUF4179 domain-containing protein [Tepidibacter aestuarii]CAH2211853.1 conserved protein of unknown function [Tepidibacter aestuarii]